MVNMYIYIIDQARGQDEKILDVLLKTLSKNKFKAKNEK